MQKRIVRASTESSALYFLSPKTFEANEIVLESEFKFQPVMNYVHRLYPVL